MDEQAITARVYEAFFAQRLKRNGQFLQGNCPFHHEHTPSFAIHPDGSAKCYGACGRAGYFSNAHYLALALLYGVQVTYTAEQHRMMDERLARLGLVTPLLRQAVPHMSEVRIPSRAARQALIPALQWCSRELLFGPDARARAYFFARGLSPEYLHYVGYCPRSPSRQLELLKVCDAAQLYETGFINARGGLVHAGRLILQEWGEDDVRFYQSRRLIEPAPGEDGELRYRHAKHWSAPATFLEGKSHAVHLVEGLIDGLTLHALGMTVCVTWSAANVARSAQTLQQLARQGRSFVLWQDPGEAGKHFVTRLSALLETNQVQILAPPYDANAWWRCDPDGLRAAILERIPDDQTETQVYQAAH